MSEEYVYDESKLCILFRPGIIYAGSVWVKTPDGQFCSNKRFDDPSWIEINLLGKTRVDKGLEALAQCKADIKEQITKENGSRLLQRNYGKICPKTESVKE